MFTNYNRSSETFNNFLENNKNFKNNTNLQNITMDYSDNPTTDYKHCIVFDNQTNTYYSYIEFKYNHSKKVYQFLVDANAVVTKLNGGKLGSNAKMHCEESVKRYIRLGYESILN